MCNLLRLRAELAGGAVLRPTVRRDLTAQEFACEGIKKKNLTRPLIFLLKDFGFTDITYRTVMNYAAKLTETENVKVSFV